MKSANFSIDQSLIRISARHVADMRLIHNIRNEFEVYRNRLIVPDARVYGINNDLVFAMVVFKNAHLSDFEKIRRKDSTLDHLYWSWRRLVRANLKAESARLADLRTASELDNTADIRTRRCARRLLDHIELIRASMQSVAANGGPTSLSFVGEISEAMLQQRSSWHAIASGARVQLQARTNYGYTVDMSFSSEQLESLLGITINQADWEEPARSEIDAQIAACEENIRFLRHHTWAQLSLRPEFILHDGQKTLTFDQLIHEKLASPLIEELVRRDFITSHFALYTSTYYGTHLGPDALEYVRRCIEPGEPDILFQLDAGSVQQLLIEQGADKDDDAEIFDDPSIFNVSIVDYLMAHRPQAAANVAKKLVVLGAQEAEFIASYCARGQDPEGLLAAMAPQWSGALQYAATEAPLPSGRRGSAVDAVLSALPHSEGYDTNDKVRDFLESNYTELASVASPASSEKAGITLGIFASCKAMIRDVTPLNDKAREQVIALQQYPVTRDNLLVLSKASSIALDALFQQDERVYIHAIDHLSDYLVAIKDTAESEHTIEDPRLFAAIVSKAGEKGNSDDISRLVTQSNENCLVVNLSEVPSSAWPPIIAENRAPARFTNIYSYVAEFGQVDAVLAAFLVRNPVIEYEEDATSLESRREVAQAILNAVEVLPGVGLRIGLAIQLNPGELPAQSINAETGEFAARLIEEGLIPDDAATFASGLMVDWTTLERAIVASTSFRSFVSPETLLATQIPQLILSERITKEIKKTVITNLTEYLSTASQASAEEIASTLNGRGWKIGAERIRVLMTHGVAATQIVQLIIHQSDMPTDTLRGLLRGMEGPYERLADPGHRPVLLPNDQIHRALIRRLEGVTVSSVREVGTELRVNLLRVER